MFSKASSLARALDTTTQSSGGDLGNILASRIRSWLFVSSIAVDLDEVTVQEEHEDEEQTKHEDRHQSSY
jgi:hypothetical protein